MECLRKFTHANKTIKLFIDPDPLNPRTEWDNLSTFAHWHPRYDLGEKMDERIPAEADMRAHLEEKGEEVLALLPLYLFDHSGLSVSTGPFGCRWDSGQVGWVYVTKESAEKMGCLDAGWDTARYEEAIKSEVKNYDDYLTGRVYGYEIKGMDGDDLDSCWGFVGDLDDCEATAKSAAEHTEDPAVTRQAEELQARATYAGVGA